MLHHQIFSYFYSCKELILILGFRFFEFIKNGTGGINLCVTSTSVSHDGLPETDEDLGKMFNSLGISRADYLSVLAAGIGMTLKASLFDSEGRILAANLTRGQPPTL